MGLDHIRDLDSFDAEFSPTGNLLSYTSYLHSGKTDEQTTYFYDDVGQLTVCVDCDAAGRCKEISHQRTEGDGQWIHYTTRTQRGVAVANGSELYRGEELISMWTHDGEGRTKREKHFQYAGNKLFKSVSLYYAARRIVERWITSYDSEGRISKTFGLNAAGQPLGDGKYIYEYDHDGRTKHVWSFNDLDPRSLPNALTIYEYECDDRGNWTERRKFHQFRSETSWTLTKTIRRLTYFP